MDNNELKEKIRKNIKEEIAILNIKQEFSTKISKNKRRLYTILSVCAVFILGIGIFLGTNKSNNNILKNTDTNIELNINKIENISMKQFDMDIKQIEINNLPEKMQLLNNVKIPEEYELENSYNIYTRNEQEDSKEPYILHDYLLIYNKNNENNIRIAISEIENPLKNYYMEEGSNISKIEDVEVIIYQWKQMYIANFEYKELYFNIETKGITEKELVTLLKSIIKKNK